MSFGDTDRDVFLNSSEFGSVVVTGATTSTGILSFRWYEEEDGAGTAVRTQRPVLTVKRGAFTLPALDATVTVGGIAYLYRGKAGASLDGAPASSGFEDWLLVGGTTS